MENEDAKKIASASLDYIFDSLEDLTAKVSTADAKLKGLELVVGKIVSGSPNRSTVREDDDLTVTDDNSGGESATVVASGPADNTSTIADTNEEVQKLRTRLQAAMADVQKREEQIAAYHHAMEILNGEFRAVASFLREEYTSSLFAPKWSTSLALSVMGMAEHVGTFLRQQDTPMDRIHRAFAKYASEEDFPVKLRRKVTHDE